MGTENDIHTVDIDLDRVLWDAEDRRRVIDALKRRRKSPPADPPPPGRDRSPASVPADEPGTDRAKGAEGD